MSPPHHQRDIKERRGGGVGDTGVTFGTDGVVASGGLQSAVGSGGVECECVLLGSEGMWGEGGGSVWGEKGRIWVRCGVEFFPLRLGGGIAGGPTAEAFGWVGFGEQMGAKLGGLRGPNRKSFVVL